MLFKVEVVLHPDNEGILPFGARREVVTRYDQTERWDKDGFKMIQQPRTYEYLVFDDLEIPFSGVLLLTYPFFDYWEVPWPIEGEGGEPQRSAEATFADGLLVGWTEQGISDSEE